MGSDAVNQLSRDMQKFYWPVALHGVPGEVYAMPGGDFAGVVRGGQEMSAYDRAHASLVAFRKEQRARVARHRTAQSPYLSARMERRYFAFNTLTELLAAQRGGKGQPLNYTKTSATNFSAARFIDMWTATGLPAAGTTGGAAPGGTAYTSASTGALSFANPPNANTGHFVTWTSSLPIAGATNASATSLLLIDRLFAVAKTDFTSTATEAVTGTFSRYQSQTSTDQDYIGGNFMFPVSRVATNGAAHNWTAVKYTNQAGTTGQTAQTQGKSATSPVGTIDMADFGATNNRMWFHALAAGDVGVKALTQMQQSASGVSGSIDYVVAHALAWLACPVQLLVSSLDGISSSFNLVKIFDNACLSFIVAGNDSTTAATINGQIAAVSE